jgi:uncharacterized membrane protein SpoIIM required for sporulation
MNQDAFIEEKSKSWKQFRELLDRTATGQGIKEFTEDEVHLLGSLYRKTCSDLSYARSRKYEQDLIRYLNQLARRGYGVIYLVEQRKKGELLKFFTRDFPELSRVNFRYILATFIIFSLAACAGYIADRIDARYTRMLVPQQFLDIWDTAERAESRDSFEASAFPIMSSHYLVNNFKVGINAFVLGITLGLGTLFIIVYNGVIFGAIASLVVRSGYHVSFFSFVMPHVFIEIMAIFICGGAGFMITRAMLAPGDLSIKDSLNVHGKDAVKLLMGTIPMFLLAAIIEASFSRMHMPLEFKALFGLLTVLLMYYYFTRNNEKTRKKIFVKNRISEGD